MKRIHKIFAGTAGALALVAMTAVIAAPPAALAGCDVAGGAGRMNMMHGGMGSAGMGPGGMGHGAMGAGGGGGMRGDGPGFASGQRLAQLKTQLAITAQQEPAWQAYTVKLTEQAKLMQDSHGQHWQAAGADTTAPARTAQQIGVMTQHLAGMQAVNTALTDLYAVLTPQQRAVADQALVQMGPGGRGRRG